MKSRSPKILRLACQRKVVETGIRPLVTTCIAHKEAGIGQIGAGVVRVPMEAYVKALSAIAKKFLNS